MRTHFVQCTVLCCGNSIWWDAGLNDRRVKLRHPKLESIIDSIYSCIHSLNLLVGSLVNPRERKDIIKIHFREIGCEERKLVELLIA
jgi:hypothetical protein